MSFEQNVLVIIILFNLSHTTSGHDMTVMTKPPLVDGCYHGSEGTFLWTSEDGKIEFTISAHITEKEWVGIGLSSDRAMGEDDVIAIYGDVLSNNMFKVASLYNPSLTSPTVFQTNESISDYSVTFNDGKVEVNITKSINSSYPISNLHVSPVYLFFAKGPINEVAAGSAPLHKHYEIPSVTRTPVLLTRNMVSCVITRTDTFIKIHGFLMCLIWLNLVPLAIYIARYAKFYFTSQSMWFTIHKYLNSFSGILVVLAIAAAWKSVGQFEFERHQTVGLLVVVVLLVHLFVALLLRPAHNTRFRRLWEILHKTAAVLMMIASYTNCVNGLSMLHVNDLCYGALTLQVVTLCLLFIVLENSQQASLYMGRICVCLKLNPKLYYSLNNTFKDDSEEVDAPGDITMVSMDLEQSSTKAPLIRVGLWLVMGVNLLVTGTVGIALAFT